MVKLYDKIFIRAAGERLTSVAKAALASGWTLLPAGCKVTQEASMKTEADVATAMGDGTDHVGSDAAVTEMSFKDFSGANEQTLRTNIIGANIDVLMYDSTQDGTAWVIWNTVLHPTLDIGSGKEAILKIAGKKRYGVAIATMREVTLT